MDQEQAEPSPASKTALTEAVARDGQAALRFAAAYVGTGDEARALTVEVLAAAVRGGAGDLDRARLFEGLRRRAAQHADRERRRGAPAPADRVRAALAKLRPSEREALLLRYVVGLSHAEVAAAAGVDEQTGKERVSRGLLHLSRADDAGTPLGKGQLGRVEEELADLVDGLAPDELADFAASDDVARDLVHDAERWAADLRGFEAAVPFDAAALERDVIAALAGTAPSAKPAVPASEAVHDAAEEATEASPGKDAPKPEGASAAVTEAVPRTAPASDAKTAEPSPAGPALSKPPLAERIGPRGRLAVVGGAVALLGVFAYAVSNSGDKEQYADAAWSGKVADVTRGFGAGGGLERCSPDRAVCGAVKSGEEVPAGSTLRTDGQTRAVIELKDGTRITLDRSTELLFDGEFPRRARLEHGAIVADVHELGTSRARLDVPLGFVETAATKFSLEADPRGAAVEVVRGSVRLVDSMERGVGVHAGEEGRLEPGSPPLVSSTATLGRSLLWSERVFAKAAEGDGPITGLGELRAKKPGEDKERTGAVTLASHTTKVRIAGTIARTEIEEEFKNGTDEVLEGIFRFPLPPDAQIERLALDVDGKLEEGAFVDRERAAAIWRGAIVNAGAKKPIEEIVWVPGPWKDPALLEWQRGGRFELRIYPIPKRGSRRIVLAYTQVLAPSGPERRYVYPLPHDPSGSTRVGRFDVDVQVRGHDAKAGVRARGYDLQQESLPEGGQGLRYSAQGFVPNGDLTVEFSPAGADQEMTAWGYQPGPDEVESQRKALAAAAPRAANDPAGRAPAEPVALDVSGAGYVAFAVRPKLPRSADDTRRSFAIVVDSSRSMFGERYQRASVLAAQLVREMDRSDEVTVLACDSTCRELGQALVPGAEAAARVADFLRGVTPEGGSDVTGAIRRARETARGAAGAVRVVYIGDGTPTIGAVQPAFVRREIEAAMPRDAGTVTCVAIGADADVGTLATVAEAAGGVLLPYAPGQSAAEAAYAVLGATYGRALDDVEIELPDGVVDVAPRHLANIPVGGEAIVVGRLTRPVVEGTVRLRGKVGTAPFEQRYPLRVDATTAKGNAFIPRLWAAAKIADLEKEPDSESRKRAVELSGRFHVASRHTSLLVLESETMFKAFGLGREDRVALWTGEDAAESTGADGDTEIQDSPAKDDASPSDFALEKKSKSEFASSSQTGLGGIGRSSGGGTLRRGEVPTGAADSARKRSAPATNAYEGESSAAAPRAFAPRPAPKAPAASEPASPPMATAAPSKPGLGTRALAMDEMAEGPVLAQPVMPPPPPRRRMVSMRKVWERVGRIVTPAEIPSAASGDAIAAAEREVQGNDLRRDSVQKLYMRLFLSGNLERASEVAERWSAKDPLDPDALTARADVAAARGERDLAIRILGSVVDVRPGDHKAQWRLARLHRWAGRAELGCRHSMAVAQIRSTDGALLAEAVRCARDVGRAGAASDLLAAAEEATRRAADVILRQIATDHSTLSGDFRLEATWDGGDDLDLSMLGPDGARVSWLGAPTKAVITARDVASAGRESLALRGASPGDYVIEITRPTGHRGTLRGSVDISAAGDRRRVPFVLDGDRVRVALVKMTTRSKLVPL